MQQSSNLILTTTYSVEGHEVKEYLGMVRGLVVRAPNIGQQVMGGLKAIIGGKIGSYREMCDAARQEALDELVTNAKQLGANAILGIRYTGSEVAASSSGSSTEVLCYGTAVKLTKLNP